MKKKLDRIEVKTTSLEGGYGVAHHEIKGERRAVFVARALAEESLVVDADFSTRPAFATIVTIRSPSAARVDAPCPYVNSCGGCDWMHITPNLLTSLYVARVDAVVKPYFDRAIRFVPARDRFGARTRARLHLESKRDGRIASGFFADRTRDIVEADACIALAPPIENARKKLAEWLSGSRGEGQATLALGKWEDARRPVIAIEWEGEIGRESFGRLERAVNEGAIAGARVIENGARRPANFGDPTPWTRGADGAPLELAPGGFAQAIESEELANVVIEFFDRANTKSDGTTIELFAGAGNFSVSLAAKTTLTCVESNADACEALRKNMRARNQSAKVVTADAAEFKLAPKPNIVLLDPPREGAKAVCTNLVTARPNHVIYISCDLQTLARDLKILDAAFSVEDVAALEAFPLTSHVETVVRLTRRR